jgi:hypothetical protein
MPPGPIVHLVDVAEDGSVAASRCQSPPNLGFLPVVIDVGLPQYGLQHCGIDKREQISGRELIISPSDQRLPRRVRESQRQQSIYGGYGLA